MKYERFLWALLYVILAAGMSACNKPKQPEGNNPPPVSSSVVGAVDDGTITTKVKAAFMADNDVKALDIKVETTNGNVKLSGAVDNQTQIDRAVEIARKIDGVTNVTNQLTIKK